MRHLFMFLDCEFIWDVNERAMIKLAAFNRIKKSPTGDTFSLWIRYNNAIQDLEGACMIMRPSMIYVRALQALQLDGPQRRALLGDMENAEDSQRPDGRDYAMSFRHGEALAISTDV